MYLLISIYLFWHAGRLYNLIFSHSSLTWSVSCHKEAEQMQMREKMHDESGEAERRRARQGEGLPGWVCGCQTKTSGGQVENIDYTVITRSERAERPWAQMEGFKASAKCCAEVKATAWQRKCSDRGKLTFNSHVGWLTDFTINSWRQYLTSGSLVHSLPHLPTSSHTLYFIHPQRQGCSKANVDVAAWLHVHCSHSLSQRTNGRVVSGCGEFPTSNHSTHYNLYHFARVHQFTLHMLIQ